ncbi:MAG TPA: zinc ribbon domain-containing protein [Geothrix sp.]|nr:zinc ribbon domain-containing protein [Geothrix sp.]
MPLYEYRCEGCGQPEERLEGFSAPEMHDCPACGAVNGAKRQLSVAAFALAGGGWYKGAAQEPPASSVPAEAPKSGHACGAGGCGCPLAG